MIRCFDLWARRLDETSQFCSAILIGILADPRLQRHANKHVVERIGSLFGNRAGWDSGAFFHQEVEKRATIVDDGGPAILFNFDIA